MDNFTITMLVTAAFILIFALAVDWLTRRSSRRKDKTQ